MSEKKTPKPIPTPEEVQRYNAVLMEEMRGQFKVFGEGLAGFRSETNGKFDALFEMVAKNTEGITDLRMRMTKVEARITSLEGRITKLEESNARIENDIRLIKNSLKLKVDVEEFNVLENRLAIVERRLAALSK